MVINNYKRHGDQNTKEVRPDKGLYDAKSMPTPVTEIGPLTPPEKVTFKWLWEHLSIMVTGTVITTIIAVVMAGITVSNWTWVQTLFAT